MVYIYIDIVHTYISVCRPVECRCVVCTTGNSTLLIDQIVLLLITSVLYNWTRGTATRDHTWTRDQIVLIIQRCIDWTRGTTHVTTLGHVT